ncbi:paired amphipathic helix protein Sin3-like 4 [Trifolium pratense]|uniref:paired amphipathic helix protein Sin3-like 4 n=1 Tax=Trifolium pratense TaxID=57577 RepID=UPI001E692554|nr:paired amphipathic helix protein Sin3-like 4 [Trifolium pratense]
MENRRSMEHCRKDALELLLEIQNRFIQQNKRDKFDEFIRFYMAYHKEKRTDGVDYTERFKEIFKDNRDLLLRLNNFLPIGCEIKLPSEGEQSCPKKHVKMEDAINFLKKIKARFHGVDDVHIYYSLLNVLNMYYKKQQSFTDVCQEVAFIFKGYSDILDEFTHFLPEAYSNYFATQNSDFALIREFEILDFDRLVRTLEP